MNYLISVFQFFHNHAAYLAGVGFAALAASEYLAGDTQTATKTFMLALTSFGLKSSIEKVFSSVSAPDASTPPTVPPAK